jgi:hypothetical protein
MRILLITGLFILSGCLPGRKMNWPDRPAGMTGTAFYQEAAALKWEARDSLVLQEVLSGNLPPFLRHFVPVKLSIRDSTGNEHRAMLYVAPDYLSVGNKSDWARVCISPYAAQRIADSFHCFLPTRKLVDDIYRAARVKPEPVPMYAFRDSTPTMWQHHLIIEGQRKGRKGLIAGIKKDVVLSATVSQAKKTDRVAIYGWHKRDGQPIQPLYTGHVYWWVDYSQGIRLLYRKIKVDGHWMDYTEILRDPLLARLLCDEQVCDFTRYPTR